MKRDYGVDLPITTDTQKPGNIVSAGKKGNQGAFEAHVGLNLGKGLFVGQSPDAKPPEARVNESSNIRIRLIDKMGHSKTTYRSTGKI